LLCASLAALGLRITAQTNHEIEPFDQGAYIGMSKTMEGSWYPWYSDGTRNPLFPWIAATFLEAQEADFFENGKRLNVLLAICGTAALAVFFSRRLGPLPAFNATALSFTGRAPAHLDLLWRRSDFSGAVSFRLCRWHAALE
jgi:hypothetical protein